MQPVWKMPNSSRLITRGAPDRQYIDLTRSSSSKFTDVTDKGIYTCCSEGCVNMLHIGLYNSNPGAKI